MPSGVYVRTDYHKNILKLNGDSGRFMNGENHRGWKGGIRKLSKPSEYLKLWRHGKGLSRKYNNGENIGKSYTKEYKRLNNQAYKSRVRLGGKLSIQTIQLVYEDNIKRFGTLTCYLCEQSIPFGKDHLEHRIPLSRGGTNEYNNLAIACQKCNCKKHAKTETEYREEICLQ